MAEENDTKTPDPLLDAVAELVFDATVPPDAAALDRARAVLDLTDRIYASTVGRIRKRLQDAQESRGGAALGVVHYALTLALGEKAGIDDPEVRRDLLEALRTRDWITRELKLAAVRALAGHPGDDADETAAEQLAEFAAKVRDDPDLHGGAGASGGAESGGTAGPGGTAGGSQAGGTDAAALEEILAIFAFDEARLPARLHYAVRADGRQTPSTGQKNFLTGTARAIRKIAPGERAIAEAVAATAAILLLDGHYDPDDRAFYDQVRTAYAELHAPASATRPEMVLGNDAFETDFRLKRHVMAAVFETLSGGMRVTGEKLFFHAVAAVYRGMVAKYDARPPGSAGFASTARALYDDETLAAGGSGGGGSGIAFLDLPPLSDPSGGTEQIVPENIKAVSAIYTVYQCEQMLLFDVVDRIVELFMAGLLPMGGDALARKLDTYYWKDDRISKPGRAAHATRALGAPGGDVGPDVTANTDFNPTLMHVISALSEFERQRNVGNLFEQNRRYATATTGEYVRKAIRDLAANATLYGYAGAQFAAERMGRHLAEAIEILKLPRIQEIYGVTSMWQVLERVAQSEFGTTVNVVKHRTLAQETRAILEIVAARHDVWSLSSDRPLFTLSTEAELAPVLDDGRPHPEKGDLSKPESDRLFRAAQYFLAVNGVQNEQVYEYSQPTDTPALPSIPGMGAFGGGGGMPAMAGSGGGDVAGQLKTMLDQGQTPSPDQLRALVGF